MKHSCGAILYTYDLQGRLGIILGLEGGHWLPFKGCNKKDETYLEAARREINEETCGLVNVENENFNLDFCFSSKTKHYHFGLYKVDYNVVNKFETVRQGETRKSFIEKKALKFFPFNYNLLHKRLHKITKLILQFYWSKLLMLRGRRCGRNALSLPPIRFHSWYTNNDSRSESPNWRKN